MAAKFRTGLKIIIILLVACCVLCGIYVYATNQINVYYKPCDGDVFASSMKVKNLFATNDGNLLVTGTFLQEDNALNDTSIFVKSYKVDGKINNVSSIEIPDGFEVKSETIHSGKLAILIEDIEKKSNVAHLYIVLSNGSLDHESVLTTALEGKETASFFAFWKNDEICYAVLKSGTKLIIYDEYGTEKLTSELSLDYELNGISYANDKYFLCGSKVEDKSNYGHVIAIDEAGNTSYSINAMESEISTCSSVFEKNGRTYVLGTYFDGETYSAVKYPKKKYEDTKELIAGIAKNSLVSQEYLYGEVLLSSNFESSPWSNYFFLEIDETGKVLSTKAPFSISENFGISEMKMIDNKESTSVFFGVSKIAATINSDSYNAQVYFIDDDINTGKSANIEIPKNNAVYFAVTNDGKLICYTGLTYANGSQALGVKIFDDTTEFAKAQKKLVICEKIVSYFKFLNDRQLIFGLAVFLILYLTARMSGKSKNNIAN